MHRTNMFKSVALYAVLLAGCSTKHYEITMTPKGDRVERTLAVAQTSGSDTNFTPVDADELSRIAAAFQQDVPAAVNRHFRFQSLFSHALPNDVGGHGTYVRWDSPCGSVTGYIERFRGDDDLIGELDARRAMVGTVIDLLDRWAEHEWGTATFFPRMRESLRTTIRRDLENLACLTYIASISEKPAEDVHRDLCARIVQYLLERQYLDPNDVPQLVRSFVDPDETRNHELILKLQQTLVLRLCHLADDPAARDGLQPEGNANDLLKRLTLFLETTPEYHALVQQAADVDDDREIDPTEVITMPLQRALMPHGFLRPTDHVALRLESGVRPFSTNGVWKADQSIVEWDFRIETRIDQTKDGHPLPRLCYALWAEPQSEFQKTHFGGVVLAGEDLSTYCLWYRSLTPAEMKGWDTFVEELRPGDDLSEKLAAFRFPGEAVSSADDGETKSLATTAVQLILKHQTESP